MVFLLGEIEPETGVLALDGFNSSAKHAGSSVIHEVDGIDFSAGTTALQHLVDSTGTIVSADIAKATSSVDTLEMNYLVMEVILKYTWRGLKQITRFSFLSTVFI